MSTIAARRTKDLTLTLPLLENGDHLTQAEFHRRYEAYPEHIKAELIEGIVYMASPLRRPHGKQHPVLSCAMCLYEAATPGVELLDNSTIVLSGTSEVQADLTLRLLPEWGGRSHTTPDDYVEGGPELLAEIAHATRNIDLYEKRAAYERAGVVEYIVVCLEEKRLYWFDFAGRKEIRPGRDGISKSKVFPGLWLDGAALLARDTRQLVAVVQEGLSHRSHAAFVRRLQARRRRK